MAIYTSLESLIGHTPLVHVQRLGAQLDLQATLLVKLECMNPAGSVKDRAALNMLDDAAARGVLTPESVIIEPTSGNTGIGLAAVGTARGHRVIIVMPDSMSVERQRLMQAYGAELVLTPGAQGMAGAIAKAKELAASLPHSFLPDQFGNSANRDAHLRTTGPEIWADTEGAIDYFVSGVGTGGTITGVGQYLKGQNPAIQVVAVEPADSPVLSGGNPGGHKIQGIGAGFIPGVLDTAVYDQVLPIHHQDAFTAARLLAKHEGLLVGISSGAALWAGITLAQQKACKGKTIVALLPDTGERYLSTELFFPEG